jgi:hypothetical protein
MTFGEIDGFPIVSWRLVRLFTGPSKISIPTFPIGPLTSIFFTDVNEMVTDELAGSSAATPVTRIVLSVCTAQVIVVPIARDVHGGGD